MVENSKRGLSSRVHGPTTPGGQGFGHVEKLRPQLQRPASNQQVGITCHYHLPIYPGALLHSDAVTRGGREGLTTRPTRMSMRKQTGDPPCSVPGWDSSAFNLGPHLHSWICFSVSRKVCAVTRLILTWLWWWWSRCIALVPSLSSPSLLGPCSEYTALSDWSKEH